MMEDLTHRILVVEDSRTTSSVLRQMLSRRGYLVDIATSGEEAVSRLDGSLPDLILCDLNLPGISGYDVLAEIRRRPEAREIPFLLVSSRQSIRDKVRGFDLGADDYITKPFQVSELAARVRTHLKTRDLRRELARATDELNQRMDELENTWEEIARYRDRTMRDLKAAGRVQRGLLPTRAEGLTGFDLDFAFYPAEIVAGDYYDFFPLGPHRWAVAVGDVEGKGVAASLMMVFARTMLRSIAVTGLTPAQVLGRLNRSLVEEYGTDETMTLSFAVVDVARKRLTCSSAGHESPLLIGREEGWAGLAAGGPILGVFPEAVYSECEVELLQGDRLFLYTDGLFDGRWRGRPLEEPERTARFLRARDGEGVETLVRQLGLDHESGRADDVTLLMLDCLRSRHEKRIFRLRLADERELDLSVQELLTLRDIPARQSKTILRDLRHAGASHFELTFENRQLTARLNGRTRSKILRWKI